MSYRVPFYKPTYLESLQDIDNNKFASISANAVDNLESKFKVVSKESFALSVNNPSSAIHLALCALELKRGDKVICAVNSYVDVPAAIRHFDSEPIFTDIEQNSYNMSVESLKSAIKANKSKKLRAVVLSHFSGLSQETKEILAIAKENKLVVIEDFSSATVVEEQLNIVGDIALFSLNYKLDNTLKGAMLTFKDEVIYNRAKLVREHGLKESNKDVKYLYDILDIGCDYRLDALSAYLLDGLLLKREELVKKRVKIANIYFKELDGVEHIKLPIKDDAHQYSYFIIEVDKNRDAFARELKELGVEVGLHYIPLNFTTYYKKKYGLKIFSFPNALEAYQKVMSIPCNSKMSLVDAAFVSKMVKEVAAKHI